MLSVSEALWLSLHLASDFRCAVSVQGQGWLALTVQRGSKRAMSLVPETVSSEECFAAWNALIWEDFVRPKLARPEAEHDY